MEMDQSGDDGLLSPLLKRIFENRNVADPAQLKYPLARLLPPDSLKNVELATELLIHALGNQQRILVIGDYDTDGATATVLAMLCLRAMGAGNIDYLVPNRFDFGYGLSPEIAEVALAKRPDLVITVDNGISSVDGVRLLKKNGVSVIITDHHLAGPTLPDADAIVNPNQPGCNFPGKALAGVGVMFYLLLSLRAKLKSIQWFEQRNLAAPNLAAYLDLVALGTVADVVPLDYNNQILVARGLARIRAGRCRAGILALMETGGKHYSDMVSSDLGFVVAPRLNAAGRLEDISIGIECLLTDERVKARQYAQMLNEINFERRAIEHEMQSQAMETVGQIVSLRSLSEKAQNQCLQGFCLYQPGWHQGITGLVASRIKDKTDQPVIAFAENLDKNLTGSARSIPGLHIKDILESIAIENPGLMIRFGGHAMAAGLTIRCGDLDVFKSAFHSRVARHFASAGAVSMIHTDGALAENEITLANAEQLRQAAPWGQGFPSPLFDGQFKVMNQKVVGRHHLKLTLASPEMGTSFTGIAFRVVESADSFPRLDLIHAVYQLDVNEFRGRRSLQLVIEYFYSIPAIPDTGHPEQAA